MSTHRPSLRRRRAVAAASTLLVLTALAGCGDGEDGDDVGSKSSAGSPSETSGATAAPADESGESTPRTAGEQVDTEDFLGIFEAAVDQASSANVTMQQSASGLQGEGSIDYASDPVAMQMTATMAPMGEVEIRLVDNVMYMLLPPMGDKFVAFDLDDPNNPMGGAFTGSIDADAMLSTFAEGIRSATYVGEEDVDGEAMDHYTVISDPGAMLADLELPDGAPPVDLPKTQTIDVWFDDERFFRRIVTDVGELGTTTMTFDDWGTDVSIEAPPSDQVTTLPGAPAA